MSVWEDSIFAIHMNTEWVERAQLMLEQAGDRIDYMSIHRYAHPYKMTHLKPLWLLPQSYNER